MLRLSPDRRSFYPEDNCEALFRRHIALTGRAFDVRPSMTAVIRATETNDLPALAKFLVRIYNFDPADHHADPQLLDWKYLCPKPGGEASRSYLIESDGQIQAHCGICPVTFHLPDSTTVNSLTMMDWAADRSIPGVGVRLFRKLMEMAPTSFVVGGAPATRHILPRIGFRSAGKALTYAAWLRPWREFKTRPRTQKSTLRLLHGLAHPVSKRPPPSDWQFVRVDQFDDSISALLNTKRAWTYCQRTVADLNHLLQCPHLKMQGFLLQRRDQIIGYFVLGIAQWEARLLELVVNPAAVHAPGSSAPADDWRSACAAISQAAQLDPEVCRLRALASFPLLTQALIRNGYWCQYQEPIMVYDPAHTLDHAFPIAFQLYDGDSGY